MLKLRTPALLYLLSVGMPAAAQGVEARASRSAPTLAPGSRPMFVTVSLAPAFGLSNAATQFKLGETFGYHLSGDGSGFAIGGEIQESFGSNAFGLAVGPKIWFDLQLSKDFGIYLSPSFMAGLGYASTSGGVVGFVYYPPFTGAGFDMQFGVEVRMVLADRGLLFVRPVTIDVAVGDVTTLRYDLVFGGGATF